MAIDWQKVHERSSGLPYTGDEVLLAIPHRVGEAHGGDLDPDYPYSLHLARWDEEQAQWSTNVTDEDTGGIMWLDEAAPTFWAELQFPT